MNSVPGVITFLSNSIRLNVRNLSLTCIFLSETRICKLDTLVRPGALDLLLPCKLLLDFEGSLESSGSLLVHFGSGCNSINGHVNDFLGLYDDHDLVNVLENVVEHFNVCVGGFFTRRVSAGMNDSVHV